MTITDEWYDAEGNVIWPVCVEWAELHGINPDLLAGIFEWHGESAWYPPDEEPITKQAIFRHCAVNYGVYRFNNPPSEDVHLYGYPFT